MAKIKTYEVEYEQTVTLTAKIEATSQREAVRLAKEEREDYRWEESNRTAPYKIRIAGTKNSSAERLFARYRTYQGEPGNPEQWKANFEKAFSATNESALSALGLSKVPATIGELRTARRLKQSTIHPDLGGSEEESARINKAFEDLKKQIETQKAVNMDTEKESKTATKDDKIEAIARKLRAASKLYYDGDNPGISDEDFDNLRDQLESLAPKHPFLSEIGSVPSSGVWPKVEPIMPMGSQKKIKTEDELSDWFRSYTKGSAIFWSDKLDGGSIEQVYENGVCVRGATRGGGNLGEDITANVKIMQGVPENISYKGRIAIRSEVMLTTDDWKTYFADKKEARSAASGQARSKKNQAKCKYLRLYSFDAFVPDDPNFFKTKSEIFEFLKKEGFIVPNHGYLGRDINKMQAIKDSYEDGLRAELPYEIDGLVVEVDDLAIAKELGESDGRPRGARAYKFKSLATTTELIDIVWQVGRTCIAPVGIIKPVTLGGSTINRVTLCNIDKINDWGLGIGSKIRICRSNDVIPKLLEALTPGEKIIPPANCPSCNAPTRTDGIRLYCTGEVCENRTTKTIIHYLKALDVKGLGKTQTARFVETKRVETPLDLYTLTPQDFDSEKIGVKVLTDLAAKSQDLPVFHFVKSLGFRLFGRGLTKKALTKYPTFEKLRAASANQLAAVEGIGGEAAQAAIEGFEKHQELIDGLLRHVSLRDHTVNKNNAGASGCDLVGKIFIFTGYRNKEAEAIIESRGGQLASGVSSRVSYIVTKDPNSGSSKMKKARELGIKILDAEGLNALLG